MLLVVARCLFLCCVVVGCILFDVVCCLQPGVYCSMIVVRCSLFVVVCCVFPCCVLFLACLSVFVVRRVCVSSLFVVCCLLLHARC